MSGNISSVKSSHFYHKLDEHSLEESGNYGSLDRSASASKEMNIFQDMPVDRNDKLNLHVIWTSVSRYAPGRFLARSYREKMAEAYIVASYAANRAEKNLNTSLWTDMPRNLSSLLRPVVRENGTELEIPHSMITRSRLQVRPERDLEDLIGAVDDKDLRLLLMKIYNHPMTENVGARSDLLRHLCGMLDPGKVNIYSDVDDLTRVLTSEVRKIPEYSHLTHDDLSEMSEVDKAKMLIRAIGDALIYHTAQTKTTRVDPKVLGQGHLTWSDENSVQGQVPGHKQGEQVAKRMLTAMNSGQYKANNLSKRLRHMPLEFTEDDSYGYKGPLKFISELTKFPRAVPGQSYSSLLSTFSEVVKGHDLTINRTLIDHFRFAESVRQSQQEVQNEVDAQAELLVSGRLSPEDARRAQEIIAALEKIFDSCVQLIEATVNVSTYLSQVGSHSVSKRSGKVAEFYEVFREILGDEPYHDSTDSWKGKITIPCEIPDEAHDLDDSMMAEVFLKVRNIVLKRLGGGYQFS